VQLLALYSKDSGQGDVDPLDDVERERDAQHEEKTVIGDRRGRGEDIREKGGESKRE
jgi:hypothetical protein